MAQPFSPYRTVTYRASRTDSSTTPYCYTGEQQREETEDRCSIYYLSTSPQSTAPSGLQSSQVKLAVLSALLLAVGSANTRNLTMGCHNTRHLDSCTISCCHCHCRYHCHCHCHYPTRSEATALSTCFTASFTLYSRSCRLSLLASISTFLRMPRSATWMCGYVVQSELSQARKVEARQHKEFVL